MEMLGKYGLLEKLGEEILGPVYKAYDSSSHRNVMLITLGRDIPWNPTLKDRFAAECAAILQLRHPNLAAVYEQGEDRKISFLAGELLPGKNLAQLIAEKSVTTLEWKIAFMVQAAAGLTHAHTHGVLHRCLRPIDFHLLPDGVVKVSGFGCGSIVEIPDAARRTSITNIYQSPEQLTGREATAQSDIFSLGLIFYEFVTGVHPFHDADLSKTLDCLLHQPQFPTVEHFPDLPFNLWPVLERCLAKEPEERYSSMQDLGLACQGMLEELAEDSECMRIELQTALPRLRKAAKRGNAPLPLTRLQSEIEQVLLRVRDSDYQSLNRLILTLTEQHHLLESAAEATSTCPPVSLEIPPEPARPAEPADNASAEPATGAQGLAGTPHRASETKSSPAPDDAGKSSAQACPSHAPNVAVEASDVDPAGKVPDAPAIEPTESRQFPAPEPAAESTSASKAAKVEPSRSRPAVNDSFSELLRKIDQGQESTQKLVDSFLAGRQKMASARSTLQRNEQSKSTTPTSGQSSSPGPVASPQASQVTTAGALTPEALTEIRTAGIQGSPVGTPLATSAQPLPAPPKRKRGRTALWICASTVLLALTFAIPEVRNRLVTVVGKDLVQKGWKAIGGGNSVQTRTDDPMTLAVRNQLNYARRDVLLEEAEILHAVGRRQEARTFLYRLLELYPDYSPAREELDKITAEINAPADSEDPQSPTQKLLDSASLAIKTGNLQKAKTDLDAAEQLEPGLPAAARLRKSLEAKKNELAQSAARDQEAQLRAKQQSDSEALALRAEELYRQGKYDDALAAVDAYAARYPPSTQVQAIRDRAVEVKQNLKSFETAVSTGKPAEAQAAVEKIEMINPADPGLAAMRRRAESASVSGSASLSIYPIAEPAVLILDDRTVGTAGELVNHTVSAGRHKIAARIGNNQIVEVAQDFANGQAIALVYDVPGRILRPMVEPDRARVARSKARMQTHRFAVEHSHGVLRGSCKGDLVIDYYHVMYQPTSGPHVFSVYFKDLRLRIENRNAVLTLAANGNEFFTFKLPDAPSAELLRKVWDDLAAPDR